EPFGDRGEAGDVDEEDGDLLALAFERAPRGQDFLGEVLGRIAAGRIEARRGGERRLDLCGEGHAARVAELATGVGTGSARSTEGLEGCAALPAELSAAAIRRLTTGTLHSGHSSGRWRSAAASRLKL